MLNLSVGNKIKILRKGRKLTQDELSQAVDIKRANLSNYETGRRIPPLKQLQKIADYFGVGLDYFGVVTKDETYELVSRAKDIFKNPDISKQAKEEIFFELMNLYNEIRNEGK